MMKEERQRRRRQLSRISAFLVTAFVVQLGMTSMLLGQSVGDEVFNQDQPADPLEDKNRVGSVPASQDELGDKDAVVIPDKVPYKDPRLACILSFIVPGSGEFYLRKDLKGVTFCLSTSTAYLLSFYFLYQGFVDSGSSGKSKLIAGGIGAVAGVILHIVGMVESYNDAVELNEARYYFSE